MFLDIIVLSILLTLLLKGNPMKVLTYRYRCIFLFPIPLFLQLLGMWWIRISPAFNIGSYILLLVVLSLNFHIPGILYVFSGVLMNTIAVSLNGGKMPVLRWMASQIGIHSVDAKHVFVDTVNWRILLGDIATVVFPWGRSFVISVGDVLITLGIAIFFLSVLKAGEMQHERAIQ